MSKTPPEKEANTPDSDLLTAFAAGEVIFAEDAPGDHMYIIERGEIEIFKRFGPRERRLTVLGVGDFFGEGSVLEETPRTATARALTDCRVLPIDPPTFDQLLRDHPEITVRLLHKLSRRLREKDEEDQRAKRAAAGVLGGVERAEIEPIVTSEPERFPPTETLSEAAKPPQVKPFATTRLAPSAESDPLLSSSEAVFPEPRRQPPMEPAAHLVHVESGASFPVAPGYKSIIGRFDPVTGKHPEVDLEPVDPKRSLSRRHARIWLREGKFFVREEIGVTNGTYIQSQKLAAGEEFEILDGDRLRLGLVEVVLQVAAGS